VDQAYDVSSLSQELDLLNIMTYDLHGFWDSRAAHHAPLYAEDTQQSVVRLFRILSAQRRHSQSLFWQYSVNIYCAHLKLKSINININIYRHVLRSVLRNVLNVEIFQREKEPHQTKDYCI
jgi:GH18 family chitinase